MGVAQIPPEMPAKRPHRTPMKEHDPAIHHRQRYLERSFSDNDLVEVRLIGDGPVRAGVFNDAHALRSEVRRLWREGNFYASLNRPRWRRADNRLRVTRTALRDEDIIAITRIPFDIDPVRPKDSPADQPELKASERQRDALVEFLLGHGWPTPLLAIARAESVPGKCIVARRCGRRKPGNRSR